ncbi:MULTISPECIES: phosphatase PAP2 family protein [unclassified Pseudomonas]|uniref:phosphatase PAP2 family protein n=1 Tax=unclassified Pseudomonas TaxID=196821 RepID=UPI000BC4C7CF|nr:MULTISPECIES: phosphatase PAP2 family protein [unclassified Pseudomonas]PVZ16198.1 membrane-associated PAP2 superfamily phosphatase [Pseudomonas sp. URIL14HWK12:I12]PVZ25946.1 membrane-associated PAP2 superfamily phosphatase [Pseudomonas sp. URIL14HWK12:I10]PVZ36530.1 membrane-associated PAP2 superfamily phosphatase [Pseudomonas sp. URIL14HWK12:I11]SNZ13258.1 Membrane-associated enzyme, PAP2 (acid phosphatase) superfamily [Pseudomonas sp. URIL14HWK12:I9]
MPSSPSRPPSRPLNLWLVLGIPLVIAALLILLELTDLDMYLARLAYDPAAGDFIGRHSYFLENFLHDRAKQVVIAIGLLALAALIGSLFIQPLKAVRRELGCLVLSMALATSFVTPMKQLTQVQCPWSLKEFGGSETYSKLLQPRPATDKPGLCWPGGHAATGFTLFALFFVFRDRKPRVARGMFVFALVLGSIFSIGRMLQGAHFFSHNVWTAVFCWLICLGAYYAVLYRRVGEARKQAPAHLPQV